MPGYHKTKRILFIQLEFPTWQKARHWSYAAQLGLEEGFQANGVEFLTLPALWGQSSSAPNSWLGQARELCAGKHFDQVWVEMIHSNLEEGLLEWLATLAPVRIAFLPESLEYDPGESKAFPHLKERHVLFVNRLKYFTHILTIDEKDSENLNVRGGVCAMWCPAAIPARFICKEIPPPNKRQAIFYGALYGPRAAWLEHLDLKHLLVHPVPPEDATDYPKLFDRLHQSLDSFGRIGQAQEKERTLTAYLEALRRIRREVFYLWIKSLQEGCAVVNLPHLVKSYASRVVETMAAGRPVISWAIPDRPRNRALFQEGEEILLFPKEKPSVLVGHIHRMLQEPEFSRRIAENAWRKVKRLHTVENRVQQILNWVDTGQEPIYEEREERMDRVFHRRHCPEIHSAAAERVNLGSPPDSPSIEPRQRDEYYTRLFTQAPNWSTSYPNEDERARWSKISALLNKVATPGKIGNEHGLRILDVGCGRGWMTNLAAVYGRAEGLDPVAEVVARAKKLFPSLQFFIGTPQSILTRPDFSAYDVVLASEVIEHIPKEEQEKFAADLCALARIGGHIILTTPRAEVFETWMQLSNHSRQPVDDWITEEGLRRLFLSQGVRCISHDRIFLDIPTWRYLFHPTPEQLASGKLLALYQVWGFVKETPETSVHDRPRGLKKGVKQCATAEVGKKIASNSVQGWTNCLPSQVHFLMIDKCNAKCIMCGGDYFHSRGKRLITLEKFKRMATNLKLEHYEATVLAGAGDPLLNPHLIPIIQYANEQYGHLSVALTTNGIALSEEMSHALLQCRLNEINISINAARRDVYKRIMQVDCFDRVCENVKRFIALRRLKGSGPAVQFSSAINRLNIEDLPRMVELGKEIGIESINVMYCRFYPERIRHLNIAREEDRLRNEDSLFFHQELSDQMVERAKSLAEQYGMHFGHEPLFKECTDAQPCSWPETELMVGFDGEIYPCGGGELHFKEKVEGGIYHFGNALHEPIEKFWNGDLYRALRISCKNREQGPIVECRTCANGMRPNELHSHIMHWEDTEKTKEIPEDEKRSLTPGEGRVGKSPLVSVIVPTHNRPERLAEALKSILEQSYQNLEIIVINDAGADVENIISYLNQKKNITYIKHSRNRGLAAARNTGIKVARGKYIAYLDDDDLFYPNHLEILVNHLEGTGDKVAYTDAYRAHEKRENGKYVVANRDVPYSFDFDYDRILTGNFVPVLCFMHEKSCLDEVGLFDEDLTTQEDWDLWIRMSRKFKFAHIPKVTCEFSWREDGTTMTSIQGRDFLKNMKRIYEKYRAVSEGKPQIVKAQETFLRNFDRMVQGENSQGQKLIGEGRIEEAIVTLEGLVKLSPMHSPTYDDLGALYYQKGEKNRALEYFVKALEVDASNTNAMKNLADLSLEMGRHEEAIQFYRKILVTQPKDVDALLGVGNYCLERGRRQDARLFYEKVLLIDPENVTAKLKMENLGGKKTGSDFAAGTDGIPIITETAPKLTSIIILAHNQLAYTQKCLESIFTHTPTPFELVLVDNGSTDGTPDYLKGVREGNIEVGGWRLRVGEDDQVVWKAETPKGEKREANGKGKEKRKEGSREKKELTCQSFRVIHNETNQGFALGNNQGMGAAKGDYLLLLNNDVVVTPGWLGRMKACAEKKPEIGIVGPMSNYVSGPQLVQEVSYDTSTLEGLHRFTHLIAQRHAGQAQPFWRVVGFCMLIKRAVVEKIGGFDGRFGFGNFEDDDFSLRARLAGFESWIAKDCFVHHFGNRTFIEARIDYHESLRKNWEIFKQKWGIPADVAYGAPFEMASIWKQGFIPIRHSCPLNPNEPSVSHGEELFGLGDLEAAKAVFHQIIQKDAQNVEALNNLGVIAFQQGKVDEALSYFKRALEIDPDHFESIENTGNGLVAKQDFTGAIEWFTRGLKLRPQDPGSRKALENCFAQIEDFKKAGKNHIQSHPFHENHTVVGKTPAELEEWKASEDERRITP